MTSTPAYAVTRTANPLLTCRPCMTVHCGGNATHVVETPDTIVLVCDIHARNYRRANGELDAK